VLTKVFDSRTKSILDQIQRSEDPALVELGIILLRLNDAFLSEFGKAVDATVAAAIRDWVSQDLEFSLPELGSFVCVHANSFPDFISGLQVRHHCQQALSTAKYQTCIGISLDLIGGRIRFSILVT
jgi:hypothetical protein